MKNALDMEHITTFTGEDFTPLTPDVNQIHIKDIAHALSLMCRANGHFVHFFSVAQHSINCANEAKARGFSEKIQLACLLHDANEAYISDLTRPVKKHLLRFTEMEKRLQDVIYGKFLNTPLTDEEHGHVKQIDDDMLVYEFNALMKKRVFDHSPKMNSAHSLEFTDFLDSENEFIRKFTDIINQSA